MIRPHRPLLVLLGLAACVDAPSSPAAPVAHRALPFAAPWRLATAPLDPVLGASGQGLGAAITGGDTDGDGDDDLLTIAAGVSTPAPPAWRDTGPTDAPGALADSGDRVAAASFNAHLRVFTQDATGFSPTNGRRPATHVSAADLDGDGTAEAALAGAPVRVLDGATVSAWPVDAARTLVVPDKSGDGWPDLLVVTPTEDLGGTVALYAGTGGEPLWTRTGPALDQLGASLAVGDITGDGEVDLVIVGGPGGSRVDLHRGIPGGFSAAPLQSVPFTSGVTVAVGDVHGDGFADLLVGVPKDAARGRDAGAATLLAGHGAGLTLPAVWTQSGAAGDGFGRAVLLADLTGDARADVIVGAPGTDTANNAGRVLFFPGLPGGPRASATWVADGTAELARLGDALAVLDANADGLPDLAIGAPNAGADRAGAVWIYPGEPEADADDDGAGESVDCDDNDPAIFPGARELPGDLVDQDCDGAERCFVDADHDGARTDAEIDSTDADCRDRGEALAADPTDCDDTRASVAPGAAEVAGDGVDGDCDGAEACPVDRDGDGYAHPTETRASTDLTCGGEALGAPPAWEIVLPATAVVSDLHAVDANADGFDDLVISTPRSGLGEADRRRILRHDGSAQGVRANAAWVYEADPDAVGPVVTGDIDGDGDTDLATAAGGTLSFFAWDGEWPAAPATRGATAGAVLVGAGDLTGDGRADLLAARITVAADYGLHTGRPGGPGPVEWQPVTSEGFTPRLADVNGDGLTDLISPWFEPGIERHLAAWWGVRGFPPITPDVDLGLGTKGIPGEAVAGDIDADGHADVAMWAITDAGVEIVAHRGQADGFVTAPAWSWVVRVVDNPGPMGLADLDGDGLPELLISLISADGDGVTTGGQIVAMHNDGGLWGTTPWRTWRGTRENAGLGQLLTTGDFDGDGFDDLAALSGGGGSGDVRVHVWRSARVDCDDGDAGRNRGATDTPDDGLDQDCDGADATAPVDTDPVPDLTDTDADPDTDTSTDEPDKPTPSGCGCASTGGTPITALAVLAALTRRRRR